MSVSDLGAATFVHMQVEVNKASLLKWVSGQTAQKSPYQSTEIDYELGFLEVC